MENRSENGSLRCNSPQELASQRLRDARELYPPGHPEIKKRESEIPCSACGGDKFVGSTEDRDLSKIALVARRETSLETVK